MSSCKPWLFIWVTCRKLQADSNNLEKMKEGREEEGREANKKEKKKISLHLKPNEHKYLVQKPEPNLGKHTFQSS